MRAEGDHADASLARALGQQLAEQAAPRASESRPERLLLALDEAGEHLLLLGTRLVLGHEQAAEADLPFLADVSPRHARLELRQSLREGARWHVAPWAGEQLRRNGAPLAAEGCALRDGDRIQLAENLMLRFRWPQLSSASACLELEGGGECLGANRIVLCVPGEGGRVLASPREQALLRLGAGAPDLVLVWLEREARLEVRCESGLRDGLGETRAHTRIALPLRERVSYWRAAAPASAASAEARASLVAPWGMALEPLRRR